METRDADALCGAGDFDVEPAASRDREFVLGDLVALGKVGIEIVFAGEARTLVHGAIQGDRGAHGHFDRAFVQDGKRAGETEAHRTDVQLLTKTKIFCGCSTRLGDPFISHAGEGRRGRSVPGFQICGPPICVEQPQKILVLVRSCTWTSRPMTGSYFARISGVTDASSGTDFGIKRDTL